MVTNITTMHGGKMKLKINNTIIETDGTTWYDIDDEVPTSLFIPSEIAIEVGMNFYEGNGSVFNIDDIRHDIELYFTDSIENILEQTINIIRDYGDDVR